MIHTLKFGLTNCYLITGEEGSILVDTGIEKNRFELYEKLRYKNVRLILLTHGHNDHVANAGFLQKKLNVPVGMNLKDQWLVGSNADSVIEADTVPGRILRRITQRSMEQEQIDPFPVDYFFRDGDTLEDFGIPAEIRALPGHTPGSIGLLVNGTDFIVGDAMFHFFRPAPSYLYEDREQMLKSVERIRESGAKLIYPGHGKPFPIEAVRPNTAGVESPSSPENNKESSAPTTKE